MPSKFWARAAIVGIAILAVLVSNIPVLVGYAHSTSERVFLGFDFFDDFHNYSMYIYEAAHTDHVFLQNRNNAEFDDARYFWPYFWVLGKIVAFTGLSIPIVLIGSRAIIGIALLLLAWKLIQQTIPDQEQQWIAYGFVAFAAGLGWLVRSLAPWSPLLQRIKGSDLDYTSGYNTLSGLMFPLQALAFALFLAALWCWLQYRKTKQQKYLVGMLASAIFIPFTHPPSIPIFWGTLLLATLAFSFSQKRNRLEALWREIKPLALWLIPLLFFAAYLTWAFGDPSYSGSFQTYLNWNRKDTPLLWPIGFGILGLLAILGLQKLRFKDQYTTLLLVSWLVIGLLLGLFPQGKKFLIAAHIPMALIASGGAKWMFERFLAWKKKVRLEKIAIAVGLVVLLSLTHLVNTKDKIVDLTKNPNAFMSNEERAAIRFLEQQPKGNLLSGYRIGNNAVWMTPHQSYLGHWGETLNLGKKREKTIQFFDSNWSTAQKSTFLKEEKIAYVFWGPDEKKLGTVENNLGLKPIFENEAVTIFAFQ